MSLYDLSSLEAQLAEQEEEWAKKEDRKNHKKNKKTRGDEEDGSEEEEEDLLALSAHSSADDTCSPDSSEGVEDEEKEEDNSDSEKKDTNKTSAAASSQLPADGGMPAHLFTPLRLHVPTAKLVDTAQYLLARFRRFATAHPNVKGLAKMERRLLKEVEMAEEEAAATTQGGGVVIAVVGGGGGQHAAEHGGGADSSKQPYSRCNGLLMYEILLACAENESGVVSILETEQIKDKSAAIWTKLSVDVDLVSQNGGRWIRVKGTSLKNLEADFEGNSERKPFVSTAANLTKAARYRRLPFGRHPSTVVMLSELPAADEGRPALKGLRDTVRSELLDKAGIDYVDSYFNEDLVAAVAAKADVYRDRTGGHSDAAAAHLHHHKLTHAHARDHTTTSTCTTITVTSTAEAIAADPTGVAWALSPLPEAVAERMDSNRGLWGLRGVPTQKPRRVLHGHVHHAGPCDSTTSKGEAKHKKKRCAEGSVSSPPELVVVGGDLPAGAHPATIPRLVNFDVTALVALCSDTCHNFDHSTAHVLDCYNVLRRQVEDEARTPTLLEHIYPCLDANTCAGAPRWWWHWDDHSADVVPVVGDDEEKGGEGADSLAKSSVGPFGVCAQCGPIPTCTTKLRPIPTCTTKLRLSTPPVHVLSPDHRRVEGGGGKEPALPYPFTHADLVAYIDGLAGEARQKTSPTSPSSSPPPPPPPSGGPWPDGRKLSDVIWSEEQHEAERRRDDAFPHRCNWVVSDVAMTEFQWIVRTIAGPAEARRAAQLLQFVHVVPTEGFVKVEMDPIFSVEAETADERKERRRLGQKEEKRQKLKALEEAQRLFKEQRCGGGTCKSGEARCGEAKTAGGGEGAAPPTSSSAAAAVFINGLPRGVNRSSMAALQAATLALQKAKGSGDLPKLSTHTNAEGEEGEPACMGGTVLLPQNEKEKREGAEGTFTTPTTPCHSGTCTSLFDFFPSHVRHLECSGKVKPRHKAVFGLGDALRAVTLTANEQFLKAALEQCISLSAVVHCSRALVGKKVAAGLAEEAAAGGEGAGVPKVKTSMVW